MARGDGGRDCSADGVSYWLASRGAAAPAVVATTVTVNVVHFANISTVVRRKLYITIIELVTTVNMYNYNSCYSYNSRER